MLLENVRLQAQHNQLDPLPGPAFALFLTEYIATHDKPSILICQNAHEAQRLTDEISFFSPALGKKIHLFPDWETLPYDHFSPHEDLISQRIELLSQLSQQYSGLLIVTINSIMQKVTPREYINPAGFHIKVGDELKLTNAKKQLQDIGYHHVTEVMCHGEYAVRGSVFDIFPSGSKQPYRLDLFDNEVESIRTFSPDDQLSIERVSEINLLPAREFPFDEESIKRFKQNWRTQFDSNPKQCPGYQTVSEGAVFSGIEYYLPLFFDELTVLFDYFPKDGSIFCCPNMNDHVETYWQEIQHRYEQRRHDISHPIVKPTSLWLRPDEVFSLIKAHNNFKVNSKNKLEQFPIETLPDIAIDYKQSFPLAKLSDYLNRTGHRILIAAESLGRKEVIKELFEKLNTPLKQVANWDTFLKTNHPVSITVGNLWGSLVITKENITIISESDLFGKKINQRRRRKTQDTTPEEQTLVKSISELEIGDPVVHLEHGIGRYLGLQSINLGLQDNEFLTIEYAKGDKLYVPITSLHLISRYSAGDSKHAPIHNLSSDQWTKARKKALEKAYDVAAELLGIYAQREAFLGEEFTLGEKDYETFSQAFPFEETPDQKKAIHAVEQDLQSIKPMDRVICGDVGFGKTEVAMRATFIAIQNRKQVAILVPTTLLAEQHGQNFIDRFADWPVNIAVLSRFKSEKEQAETMEKMATGHTDIVIGTHKLIQQEVKFKRLGLLIIDEEHRFGVRQKEKLKKLKSNTNILTMTATPIPRTLNMALSNLRDFSIIATPPKKRLSIKTFIYERHRHIIAEAVERELHRGGQVFFLHNNVKTIQHCAAELNEWLPSANIQVAHGQMRERELEKIMGDFYHQRFNVLVCTTIIETGIDIPTANTIIMDRADKLGLAQLHQLRGRVGRSHHQAYAYLLFPGKNAITSDAKKRLDAISSLGDLGAGFTLASHDLEIRGAGEILGEEQSGQMHEVGFSLYLDLIDKAVKDLKSGKTPNYEFNFAKESEIDLGLQALIPEDFLPNIHNRLNFYKRISDAKTVEDLDQLQIEMIDRFGLLPEPTKNLFSITELKIRIQPLGMKKLSANKNSIRIEFSEKTKIDPLIIIKLIQKWPHTYKLINQSNLRISLLEHKLEDRIHLVNKAINNLTT